MITATLLAMPVLGSSVQKAAARILGVVVGCWLFYGLYLATEAWWALALALGAWAFLLVAGSSAAGWVRSAGPPALMSAFVGEAPGVAAGSREGEIGALNISQQVVAHTGGCVQTSYCDRHQQKVCPRLYMWTRYCAAWPAFWRLPYLRS
jgi:hypothetical protein